MSRWCGADAADALFGHEGAAVAAVGKEEALADGGALLFQLGVGRHVEGGESGEKVLHTGLIAVLVQQQGQ